MNITSSTGVRLACQIDGPDDAPTLVLVNSLGTNLHMWDQQVALLHQRLRIVRYDNRGHGASGAPPGPYTLEQLGLDLLSIFETLHIEQAYLCGLSLGGMLALWFSLAHPERVKGAVFANTAARIGSTAIWDARIEAVRAGGMSAIQEAVLARFLSAGYRRSHPAETASIFQMVGTTPPEGYIGACQALRDGDLRAAVAGIQLPSLIIGGELDESTPPAQALELQQAIQGSELVILPGVAHLSNVELPEVFSQSILALIDRT